MLINAYGPTETCITASMEEMIHCGEGPATIGRPIRNTRIYVTNKDLKLQPIGVLGEICIGGVGVSRGYQHWREEEEGGPFLEDPFHRDGTLYQTGDLGYWLPDGRLGIFGRIDFQVKIRGHRVEPGEVEAVLGQHPNVRSAAVMTVTGDAGQCELCAYLTQKEKVPVNVYRDYLADLLPGYMTPAYFVVLDQMPVTQAGKLNRAALPEPGVNHVIHANYKAPRNDYEKAIVDVWTGILNVPGIGAFDHFFELGGHSLLAEKTMALLEEKTGICLPVGALFEAPRVHELAARLVAEKARAAQEPCHEQVVDRLKAAFGGFSFKELDSDGTAIRVAFTDRVDELRAFMRASAPPHLWPHYIYHRKQMADGCSSIPKGTGVLKWKSADGDMPQLERDFGNRVHQFQTRYREALTNQTDFSEYDCGHHPKWFVARKIRSVIMTRIRFDSGVPVKKVSESLNVLIQKQGLLRSLLVPKGEGFVFREYEKATAPLLPEMDLSAYKPKAQEAIIHEFLQWVREDVIDAQPLNHQLFNAVYVKLNELDSILIFALDHIIADHDSVRVLKYHFRMLNAAFASGMEPSYPYEAESFRSYAEMTWGGDARPLIEAFKRCEEYQDFRFRVHALDMGSESRARIFSEPYHLQMAVPKETLGNQAMGYCLAVGVFALTRLFSTTHVPLRVLTNRRICRGLSFYNTIGDFHDSLPVVFHGEAISPETASQTLRAVERSYSNGGFNISRMGEDPEIYKAVFKSPFNFNFVGAITARQEAESIANARVLPFVSYPLFGYQNASGPGMIFFHGLDDGTRADLEDFLRGLPGSFQLKPICN